MSNVVVVGSQWGDEGKGKIVDLLTRDADVIARFHGGNNAGHTLVAAGEKFVLHLIPSGILHPGKRCLIGNGVVLDPEVFAREVENLSARGIDMSPTRLMISNKTHCIMPYHKELDMAREGARCKGQEIGTTGRGIGPCYEDKMARVGVRAGDLKRPDLLKGKIAHALAEKNILLNYYGRPMLDPEAVFEAAMAVAPKIIPFLGDVSGALQEAWDKNQSVLFEGAQGIQLDIDHGTYPFVTSSNTVSGNAAAGCGCSPQALDRVVAVVKAYTTRVGGGPFPTELFDAVGEHLQGQGAEFGATTGRKRRCGWLDIVILRECGRLAGPTEIALTKLDVLGGLPELKICVAYRYEGQEILYPPQDENGLSKVEPIYESVPGWNEDISGVTEFADLPKAAQDYILRIETLTGVPVRCVSVGADRERAIFRS